jgi:glutamate racemase
MGSGSQPLIGFSWASADGFRRSLVRSHASLAVSGLDLTCLACTHFPLPPGIFLDRGRFGRYITPIQK